MSVSERPGVYSSYEVSSAFYGSGSGSVVGLAALSDEGEPGVVCAVDSYAGACAHFGAGSDMAELARVLFKNGAAAIRAAAVTQDSAEAYAEAFDALMGDRSVKLMVCGSRDAAVHARLRESIMSADEGSRYRVGFAEAIGTLSQLESAAGSLNSERVVLVSPGALTVSGRELPGAAAAAVCGLVSGSADPALPISGAELFGIDGLEASLSDSEISALIRAGVTPVEQTGAGISVVRGVTTRSKTSGEPDKTWRELTTTLIIDDVIPTVRSALHSRFSRSKNTAQTRGAIRTQVVIELENKLHNEIIDGYGNINVTADETDPTVCNVSFDFVVAHGLNRIELCAHITV